jgi:hypothetical protein
MEALMRQVMTILLGVLAFAICANGQVSFVESAQNLGVTQLDFGIGVALADINSDGYPEIITTNCSGPDRVYVWNGTGYDELGEQYGINENHLHHSICLVDLDKNTVPDLYITGDQYSLHGHFYQNVGGIRFEDMAEDYNLAEVGEMGSSFFQLARSSEISVLRGGRLMLMDDGKFIDITEGSGLEDLSIVLTPLFFDIDGDYDSDLFIGHNWEYIPGSLFRNNGDNTFTDVSGNTDARGFATANSAVIGDIDNDGDFDIYQLCGYNQNKMWLNDGTGYFTDYTEVSHTGYGGYTRAANFADLDNDGDLDLFINRALDYNMLLLNDGAGIFTDVSNETGIADSLNGFGSSVGDLNNDGQLDIVTVNCCDSPKQIYINQNENESYLRVKLHGRQQNAMALGAIARLYGVDSLENKILIGTRILMSHTTGCSVDEPILHFGTGSYQNLMLEVHYPSGLTVYTPNLTPGHVIDVYEMERGRGNGHKPPTSRSPIVRVSPNPFNSSTMLTVESGSGACEVTIYDILGRTVKTTNLNVGDTPVSFTWDGTDHNNNHVPSGVYFVRANSESGSTRIKVTLLK